MFHKKHTVKGQEAVSKKESKRIRETIFGYFGKDYLECLESFWKKSDAVTQITWDFSTGGSASFYLVNKIPLVISTSSLPDDSNGLLPRGEIVFIPTLFFLMIMRAYYKGEDVTHTTYFGSSVWTRGATSEYILSGAHLMMPGILDLKVQNDKLLRVGEIVFIFTAGMSWPYGIGLATSDLVNSSQRGRGVYVLHSYRDSLWDSYFMVFNTSWASITPALPVEFQETLVNERLLQSEDIQNEVTNEENGVENEEKEIYEVTETTGSDICDDEDLLIKSTLERLSTDDALLDFALCEAIKGITKSMLPLPLTEFSPLLLSNYPRIPGETMQIDLKQTKHKKMLSYLRLRSDALTVSEISKGVFSVVQINKSCELFRKHRLDYGEFLQQVHEPAKEMEILEAEQQALREGGKGYIKRRIVSIETLFSPRGGDAMELKRIICTGLFDNEIQQNFLYSKDIDNDFLDELYSRKSLSENLRKYIIGKGLLKIEGKGEGSPFVELTGALSFLRKDSVSQLRITEIENFIFQHLYTSVHQIIIEANPVINGVVTSKSFFTRITRRNKLPKILIYTEKRQGNKIVTVVKYLDTYGFDLSALANQWKQLFSTSCCVHDPSKDFQKLKQGTKVTLELHLGGGWLSKLTTVLEKELGLPQHLITAASK
ncbi:translation initiation factor 2D [Trypanosoma theileri]|uniref:Translation initiation factor 2D n=1 Tax=Trypanosoma theileri TaxID=67003 RepID=A0A1X0NTA4_9TRYP|nr:translation initiation factor 2D [Trypanosoma theileri]ORC87935.1 translation initiation factor 2D [Trypanosoma theileri]